MTGVMESLLPLGGCIAGALVLFVLLPWGVVRLIGALEHATGRECTRPGCPRPRCDWRETKP